MDKIFELATKNKYRYSSTRGMLNTEDLWDLPMEVLNDLYKSLKAEIKKVDNSDSLFDDLSDKSRKEVEVLNNKAEIVSHIFKTKRKISEDNAKALETIQRNKRIDELIQQKKDEKFNNMTIEQLQRIRNGESVESVLEDKKSDTEVTSETDSKVEESK